MQPVTQTIPPSPLERLLFQDPRSAPLWLIVRLITGWEWLTGGWEKLFDPAWTGPDSGQAIVGFVNRALPQTQGAHPNVTGWYAWFLQYVVAPNASAWAWAITLGELAVGLGLIVGLFTGIAAFFGGLMNASYLLGGTVSTNPILFILATWLVLAWKVAGWWGLDRWVLPRLGTPWWPGRRGEAAAPAEEPPSVPRAA